MADIQAIRIMLEQRPDMLAAVAPAVLLVVVLVILIRLLRGGSKGNSIMIVSVGAWRGHNRRCRALGRPIAILICLLSWATSALRLASVSP